MKSIKSALTAALLGSAFILSPMAAHSEPQQGQPAQGQPQQGQPAQPPAEVNISDAQLEKFVTAFGEVRELEQAFTRELEEIDNQEEAQALQQSTQQKMMGAVEDSGLSVEEYNEIVSAMRQDPELREEIISQVE